MISIIIPTYNEEKLLPKLLDSVDTLIGTYFPGGRIWPFAEPFRHQNHLQPVNSWFVNGLNYWRTLYCWHKRFWDSINQLFPTFINRQQVDAWNKYFSLCKSMLALDLASNSCWSSDKAIRCSSVFCCKSARTTAISSLMC